jgi:hypothetical protein
MRRLNRDQVQLFYSFRLDDVVPSDHRVREISARPPPTVTACVA